MGWNWRLGPVLVGGSYQGAWRRAILRLKENNDQALAHWMGRHLASAVRTQTPFSPQAVAAVPTSLRRQRWRGYCAPSRIAAVMAAEWGVPLVADLSCPGDPRPRKRLRRRHLELPHFQHPGGLRGRILLVDDVVTSGQTMRAARETLLRAGAEEVLACALAIR